MQTLASPLANGLMLHQITDEVSCDIIKQAVKDLSFDDAKHARYPGPNPVSLDTSHFPRLSGEPYYVCEKTDGVRYLMVCCTMPSPPGITHRDTINVCALVDRSMTAYLLSIRGLPRAAYQGTLLDGEVAWNKALERWEYLVFDALCISGVPVLNGSLPDRMTGVHRMMEIYEHHDRDTMHIQPKNFIAGSRFAEFQDSLPDLETRYDIDGLILTPARPPVVFGRHMGLFKMKFSSKHTVDFLVGPDGRQLSVFDAGRHSQVGSLYPGTTAPPGSIAECSLAQPGSTLWTLVMLRTDKSTANDMYTYQKTMLNMRENLTVAHVAAALAK